MAYGSPASAEDVESYYTHIRRGRPPEAAQLEELVRRYRAIGGTSHLTRRTLEQVSAIEANLDAERFVVRLGQKHAAPFVEDAVAELAAEGVERIVGLVLAPHNSVASVGEYHRRAEAASASASASASAGIPHPYTPIHSWHLLDELVEFQARALRTALADLPERTQVLFTAHSLPERVLDGDPYPEQLAESASRVVERAGLSGAGLRWDLAWQSAGRTQEPWRGPDILESIAAAAESGETDGMLVVPQGFTSDHLEVLYDLDIEAARAAESAGLVFARTAVVNDDPAVMGALAELLRSY
jgi:ferrochelatase